LEQFKNWLLRGDLTRFQQTLCMDSCRNNRVFMFCCIIRAFIEWTNTHLDELWLLSTLNWLLLCRIYRRLSWQKCWPSLSTWVFNRRTLFSFFALWIMHSRAKKSYISIVLLTFFLSFRSVVNCAVFTVCVPVPLIVLSLINLI